TDEDVEIVTLLAAQAAVAIENARLYESATRWSRQLESLHDVVRSLAGELDLEPLLELVCTKLRELIGARLVLVALPAAGGDLRVAEICAGRAAVAVSLSQRVARDTVRRVVEAQESERRRLALELHDETGQALTSILLGLKAIRAAADEGQAEKAEAEVRA